MLLAAAAAHAEAPPAPKAADPATDEQLLDIDRRAGAIQDLTARFEQEKFTPLLKKPLVSSGQIRVKGGVCRWDTKSPEPSVLHADGRQIRMYYPRQSMLEVYPIDKRLSELAASPLPRLATLKEHFSIEPIAPKDRSREEAAAEGKLALRLVPKGEFLSKHVDEVRVLLDVASACVARVEVIDADGDRTVIRFSETKLNTGLKEADLELAVSAGTKVSRPLEGLQGHAGQEPPRAKEGNRK
jgi:outer membrane lipoprotein-sorting protein